MCSSDAVRFTWCLSTSTSRECGLVWWLIKCLTSSRETNQKTLEEIAAAFGDKVVEVKDGHLVKDGDEFVTTIERKRTSSDAHIEKAAAV